MLRIRIIAATVDESMPPERKAPSGTSATSLPADRIPEQQFERIGRLAVAHIKLRALSAFGGLPHAPEGGRLGLAVGIDRRHMAGLELLDATIDRMGRRHIGEPQIGRKRIAVKLGPPAGKRLERLQFGGEDEAPVPQSIVERLDTEAVADEAKRPVPPIPKRKREHADETLDRRPHAPFGDGLDQNLGIGMSLEAPPARLKLWPQVARIVDLAVVADDAGATARHHGLGACRRKIDDGEPRMAEHHPGLGVGPQAMSIGTAMVERPRHGPPERFQLLRAGAALEVEEARDATHDAKPLSPCHRRRLPTPMPPPLPAQANPRAAPDWNY